MHRWRYFDDPLVELVAIIFMLMGALPFVLYLRALRGDPRPLRNDTQVHWFLTIVTVAVCGMAAHLWWDQGYPPLVAMRLAGFNVVSIITGTGYATSDFGTWGSFAGGMMFFLMFVGGCAGSTTCGIKIFRFQVLYATAQAQMRRLIQPHGVFIAYYNGKPIPETVSVSVMSFFFMYVICFAVLSMTLQLLGLDYLTAMTGAATAISNVGSRPGAGDRAERHLRARCRTPPNGCFLAGMLLGRLELFTVLILFGLCGAWFLGTVFGGSATFECCPVDLGQDIMREYRLCVFPYRLLSLGIPLLWRPAALTRRLPSGRRRRNLRSSLDSVTTERKTTVDD